ncbi:hypothetical protein Q667_17960 [Marinobacter sp. C1S70]|uniref:AAA family ATPase n=1 Tax=Marinobacter sp. C1S70 TaxID=1396859 RepID=UPI0003B8967F|nr:AAA family ATPase [Marinobacter sp. C1S70]ERS84736.1 hypothetical protein Q667_17960 [Marinobacter sp. C1S70]
MTDDNKNRSDDIEWDEELDFLDPEDFADDNPFLEVSDEPQDDDRRGQEEIATFFRFAITLPMSVALKELTRRMDLAEKREVVWEFNKEIRYFSAALRDIDSAASSVLIVALLQLPFMRQVFSVCFNNRPTKLIVETPPLLAVRRQLQQAVTRKPPGDQDKYCWYEYQERNDKVSIDEFFQDFAQKLGRALVADALPQFMRETLGFLASADSERVILQWWEKNLETDDYGVHLERSRQLKVALGEVVKGQNRALEAICDGYAQSLLSAGPGPRGIFTLMGESGTGKTLLAETFAQEISAVEGQAFKFLRFNMQQFTDEKASAALFGSSHFYSDATLGELTDQVRNYPKSVILFDEIEKARPEVIQSLLGVLDRGYCQDSASLKWVDFSQAFILFTTNLGSQRLADRRSASQVLGTLDNATLGALLQREPSESSSNGLSPEFINRLTKGRFLVFEPLKPEKLLSIYTSVWNARREELSTNSIQLPACTTALAAMQLMKRLPDLSARTAASATEMDMVECMKSLIEGSTPEAENEPFEAVRQTGFQGIGEILDSMLAERDLKTPARILLVDDDQKTLGLLSEKVNAQIEIDSLEPESHVGANPKRPEGSFDLVLIDLFIDNDDSQHKTTQCLHRILNLRETQPETPIIGFCRNPKDDIRTQNAIQAARAIEGVTAVVHFNDGSPSSLLRTVETHLEQQQTAKLIHSLLRERKRLLFSWRINETPRLVTASPSMVRLEPILAPGVEGQMFGLGEIPDLTLDAVVGNERGVRQISRALGWLKQPGRVRRFGFRPPAGYLLAGPPGTGKTFLARAAAGECGLPFFSINGAELLSPRIGVAEAQLRQLFANARKLAPAIIFFDEIDAIAAARGSSASHQGLINTLLSEMDGFGGHERPVMVLAATNFPEMLDPALKRPGRLDEVIICDLPNAPAREHLLVKSAKQLKIDLPEQMLEQLVLRTQGESAAAIEAATRQAVYLADSDNRDPTVADLESAIYQMVYGTVREDLSLAREEKWAVACHEAGHALAIHYQFPGRRIDYITIQPRTGSLGFVAHREDSNNAAGGLSMTRSEIEAAVTVALAGREAERLLLGEKGMSAGAGHDLRRANAHVRNAVMAWGLDDELGPMALSTDDLRSDPALAALCTARCRVWLVECEQRARGLLEAHKLELQSLAETLYLKESLDQDEIQKLLPDVS